MSSNSIVYNDDFHSPTAINGLVFDVDALSKGCRHSNPTLAAECKELLSVIYTAQVDAKDLIIRLTKTNVEILSTKREELVLQCRAAKQHHDKLTNNAGLFDNTTRRLNEEVNIAAMNLRAVKETQLQPAYSTDQDYADLAAKIESLQLVFDEKMANYNRHITMISTIERDIQASAEAHNSLVKKELDLRQQIARLRGDKSPIIDMTTGLER